MNSTHLVQLGPLVDILSGFAFDSERFGDTGDIPLVRIRDVMPGRSSTYYSGPYDPRYVVKQGDMLIGMDGEFNRARWQGAEALLNQRVCRIAPANGDLEARYLYHFLPSALKAIEAETPFVTVKHLSVKQLQDIRIPLPPLPEQRRIADILDKADALRAKRRAALAALAELNQSIFLEMFGDPATNPKGWPPATLGQLIEFVGGSQPPRDTFLFEPLPDTIRLVQIRDFRTDAFKTYIPKRLARRFFDQDDVMIGRYGPPVFQIFRGLSGSYNVALMKALPRDGVLKDFIYHLLQERRLHSYVEERSERTAGQSGVNLELLEKYRVYLPPIELQHEFSLRTSIVERVNAAQVGSAAEVGALFDSLQFRAFRGELNCPERCNDV